MIPIFEQGTSDYDAALLALSRRGEADLEAVEPAVRAILADVRARGDDAIRELTERYDHRVVLDVVVMESEWRSRAREVTADVRTALAAAAARIERYHTHQRDPGFRYEEDGVTLGLRVRPCKAAGVYAPGGKARYPSSVLMTAIPAKVAGVARIVLATPNPTPEICCAAELAGVTEILDVGGAQAIAALAYGTQTVRPVDKIVGPGNLYVACAKRLVFGVVDIEGIAGPSEILVVADDQADPRVVAADLLSQAEHDEDAYALLITLSRAQAEAVDREVQAQLATLSRQPIAAASVQRHAQTFVVRDLAEAARVADTLAAEHLSLQVRDPEALFEQIGAAGAAFLGDFTPEAAGDYAAGPSHVLPTGGAARFGGPLGVYDFVVRSSIIRYTPAAIRAQADLLETLAHLEGLDGHARAVSFRR